MGVFYIFQIGQFQTPKQGKILPDQKPPLVNMHGLDWQESSSSLLVKKKT